MPHIVTEACIKCKYQDCVEVCPAECFHEGEDMLVINPDECVDCKACVPECPVSAIIDEFAEDAQKWLDINRKYAKEWPNIFKKGKTPDNADDWFNVPNKFDTYLKRSRNIFYGFYRRDQYRTKKDK